MTHTTRRSMAPLVRAGPGTGTRTCGPVPASASMRPLCNGIGTARTSGDRRSLQRDAPPPPRRRASGPRHVRAQREAPAHALTGPGGGRFGEDRTGKAVGHRRAHRAATGPPPKGVAVIVLVLVSILLVVLVVAGLRTSPEEAVAGVDGGPVLPRLRGEALFATGLDRTTVDL